MKTEPNQSLQTTNRTVTECAPSRTFRASAIRVWLQTLGKNMKNKYGTAAMTVSILLILLSSILLCSCPIITASAGAFAIVAVILTSRIKRIISVFLVIAGFSAAYFDYENEGSIQERAREAVRQAEEKVQADQQTEKP
jgi:hypothetical protein